MNTKTARKIRPPRSRLRTAALRSTAIGAAAAGIVAVAAQPAYASWVGVRVGNSGVTLRDCYHPAKAAQPSTSCTAIATIPAQTPINLICQHAGQSINGDVIWDYVDTPYGQGYVSDYYIYTGTNGYVPGVDYCSY